MIFINHLWPFTLALLCASAQAAPPSTRLAELPEAVHTAVYEQVHDALLQALDPVQREGARVQIRFTAPRGAANSPCAGGWAVVGALNLRQLARVTVPLDCAGQRGSVVALVEASAPVWTLRTAIPAGQALRAGDLKLQLHNLTRLDTLVPGSLLAGGQLRADGEAGQVLQARDIDRPVVQRKGDKVEIRAQGDGVQVSVAGIATGSARLGEVVTVRNARTGRPVKGTLVAPGVLQAGSQAASGGVKIQTAQESGD